MTGNSCSQSARFFVALRVLKLVVFLISIFLFSAATVAAETAACIESGTRIEKQPDHISIAQKIKSWSENSHTRLGAFHKKQQSTNYKAHCSHPQTCTRLYAWRQSMARTFASRSQLYRLMLFPKHNFW